MKNKIFILSLIFVTSAIMGCAKKEEKKVVILPPQIPMAKPEMYLPEKYEYKSFKTQDPFIPLVVTEKKTVEGVKSSNLSQIDIINLELSGIVWDKKEAMAILHDGNKFGYILKKGKLFADNFKPIEGIKGKIIGNERVFLEQGKTEIDFFIGKSKITKMKKTQVYAQTEVEEEEKDKFLERSDLN